MPLSSEVRALANSLRADVQHVTVLVDEYGDTLANPDIDRELMELEQWAALALAQRGNFRARAMVAEGNRRLGRLSVRVSSMCGLPTYEPSAQRAARDAVAQLQSRTERFAVAAGAPPPPRRFAPSVRRARREAQMLRDAGFS